MFEFSIGLNKHKGALLGLLEKDLVCSLPHSFIRLQCELCKLSFWRDDCFSFFNWRNEHNKFD